MGFDLYIHMSLLMDETNGKPFYFGKNLEKVYELPVIEIPQELKKYLYGRGHYFHVYTDKFNRKDIYHVDVHTFLDKYPSWRRFKESDYYDEEHQDWTRDDHRNFKKLLEFLSEQNVGFSVCWSY